MSLQANGQVVTYVFTLMAETDASFTGTQVVSLWHPSVLWGPVCTAMHQRFVVIFHLWVPATSLGSSRELWVCGRSWPRLLLARCEMCRANGSRDYTEIGHTGWVSKGRLP